MDERPNLWRQRLWAASVFYEIFVVIPCILISGPTIDVLLSGGDGSQIWPGRALILIFLNAWWSIVLLLGMGLVDYNRR